MVRAKHKSVPKELKKNFSWLEKQGIKLVLGICECARHRYSPGTIRLVRDTDAGYKAIGYTGNGIMNFFIVVQDEELKEAIKERFSED